MKKLFTVSNHNGISSIQRCSADSYERCSWCEIRCCRDRDIVVEIQII